MEWSYCIEEIVFGHPMQDIENQLNELGGGGWEAVAAFPSPAPDPKGHVFVLFKQPKSK